MIYATDADLFVAWAEAVVHGRLSSPLERRFNSGCVFKRARGVGRITHVEGLDRLLAEYGELHPETLKAFDLDGPVVAAEILLGSPPRQLQRRQRTLASSA